jgi:hypothetical protein
MTKGKIIVLTSFSLFPFGSKSLTPLAPPKLRDEREFFNVFN